MASHAGGPSLAKPRSASLSENVRCLLIRLATAISLTLLPVFCYADCADDHATIKQGLTGQSLAIRNSLFSKLCESSAGALVDITDPTLGKRFESPMRKSNFASYPGEFPHDWKVPIVVAYLVDLNGSVKHPTIIIGTGNAAADAQIQRAMNELKFKAPAMVDGKPTPVLMYWRITPK